MKRKRCLSILITYWVVLSHYACGSHERGSYLAHQEFRHDHPSRVALVADSLGTALFADTSIGQIPYSRHGAYDQLSGMMRVFAVFKGIVGNQKDLFRLWQTSGDPNIVFAPYTNPYRSVYHAVIADLGNGARIVTESAIIGSKVEPESYQRHVKNFWSWSVRDFDSMIFSMGSNDICNSWQNGDQFEANYRQAIRQFKDAYPGRRLYIFSPPRIPDIGQDHIAYDHPFGVQGLLCKDIYELQTCPAYRDKARFHDFIGRMRKVAAENPDATFIDISSELIEKGDLSGDCFHPSFAGHARFKRIVAKYF
jgi:hypothetical protein